MGSPPKSVLDPRTPPPDGTSHQEASRRRAAATASRTPPGPGAGLGDGSGAANEPSRTLAATCSCASRNGTPSSTSPSAASRRGGADRRLPLPVARHRGDLSNEHGERLDRRREVVAGSEHRRLVLLEIAVVRERQALHHREQAGQPADRRSGLGACELRDVGVQLLRHHRRSGRRRFGQVDEAELGRRPETELFSDPRQMAVQAARGVEVVECEVPVSDGVERVPELPRAAAGGAASSRPRAGAERRRARGVGREPESPEVALEHLQPGEQVMADGARLRALEVGVAGIGASASSSARPRMSAPARDRAARLVARVLDVEAQRGGYLVVPRPSGVDPSADGAD